MSGQTRHAAVELTPPRFPQAREVMARAFATYPLIEYAAGNDPARSLRLARSLYGGLLRDCQLQGTVLTTATVGGAAGWLPPERGFISPWRQAKAGLWRLPFAAGWTGLRRLLLYGTLGEELHHASAAEAHWFLVAIGVDPDCQRQGIAASLIEPIQQRAARDGVFCYLDTHNPVNVPIYERLGFRVVGERSLPGHPIRVWGMRWDPV